MCVCVCGAVRYVVALATPDQFEIVLLEVSFLLNSFLIDDSLHLLNTEKIGVKLE